MFEKTIFQNFLKRLERVVYGTLKLQTPDGKIYSYQGKEEGPDVSITIHNWGVVSNLVLRGDVGFAEDYRDGHWETDDLEGLLVFGLKNEAALQKLVVGNRLAGFITNLTYLLRMNTLSGSKKNIHAHYDIGNEFYKLWLDKTMTYSSALYKSQSDNLMQAQTNKYDRIVDVIGNNSGSILEIGCGWGGFAEQALKRGDYDIKGITLSEEQHDFANNRLNGNASIVLEDYRAQTGQFDNIVSIEMFEAVGERYWPTYFKQIGRLLKDGGKAVIQTITIRDQDFSRYRMNSDFIRSYIFPGGLLPSPSKFEDVARKVGLKAENAFNFRKDYAKTLREWLKKFDEQKQTVLDMGFDEQFIRLWRFYLAACSAGFETGRTDVMQIELSHA